MYPRTLSSGEDEQSCSQAWPWVAYQEACIGTFTLLLLPANLQPWQAANAIQDMHTWGTPER
jgi:hypothetical protein